MSAATMPTKAAAIISIALMKASMRLRRGLVVPASGTCAGAAGSPWDMAPPFGPAPIAAAPPRGVVS